MCMFHVSPIRVHLIPILQCDIATILILISAWVRYAGTPRSLSKGGAYSLIIFGQVGKHSRFVPSLFPLMLSSGTVRHFATNIPDSSPQILRTVVRPEWPHDRDNDYIDRYIFLFREAESPLTWARLSESHRWWVRSATITRIPGYAQVGTCYTPSFTAASTPTWQATSKILALAVISTAIVPLGLLIVEAPPTPPCKDLSSSNIVPGTES